MRTFFDTSVLVAAFYSAHPDHEKSLAAIAAVTRRTTFCAAHTLAEVYSVLTRLPVRPRISPSQGLLFVESIRERFTTIALSEREYCEVIAASAERGISGGGIYDALILRCAEKAGVEAVYTWNLEHFRRSAGPEIIARIKTP